MVDLNRITRGRETRPPRVLVYGFEAVGKTYFVTGAPGLFVIDADRGTHKFDVQRIIPDSWSDFRAWLDAVESGKVKCESLALDSLTSLETLSHAEFFAGTTIDAFQGGYGRGDTYAISSWREILAQLERIWYQGKNIILVAHATVKTFSDPTGPSFDRFEVALRPKLAAAIRQWVDYTLFAREEIVHATKGKATTTGARWGYTRRCPAFDAKARGTLLFPERILLNWETFTTEIKKDETRGKELVEEIDTMLAEISDASLTKTVKDYIKSYPGQILEARDRVAARLAEQRRKETEDGHQGR